jgi:PEP-CTERM motif
MQGLFRRTTVIAAATLFASLSHAASVPIDSTFTFTGDCGDCTGQGMGTLVLQDYTPGDELQTSNFVSFTYSSNLLNITGDSIGSDGGLTGVLPVDLPGPAVVDIAGLVVVPGCDNCTEYEFESSIIDSASWDVGEYDYGMNGIWSAAAQKTAVPEPSSLGMLAIGLAALGASAVRARLCALFADQRTT